VSRLDDTTIREAIEREIGRGGQVFFITPTIGNMGQRTRDPRCPTPTRRPGDPAARRRSHDDEWTRICAAGPGGADRHRPRRACRPTSSRR